MILTYTLLEKEYLDAQRAFKAHLARTGPLFRMTIPIVLGALLAAAYSLFIVNNLAWGVGLCLAAAYLLASRTFISRWRVRGGLKEHPERLGPFTVELTPYGIKADASASEWYWPIVRRYYETRDLFLLSGPDRELCILPKRVFPVGDRLHWAEKLRAELKGRGRRDNPDALLLKLTATWAIAALFSLLLFAGSIHNFFAPTFRRAALRNNTRNRNYSKAPPAKPAPTSDLMGSGAVYLVPLGKPQSFLSADLLTYYRKKYGLELQVLAPVSLPAWTFDETRKQLIAEELIEAIKRAYPRLVADPDAVFVGVTDQDMYISQMNWWYAFSWRQEERFAIISTARMDPAFAKLPANAELASARARKMLTKDIGFLHYHLQGSYNYSSVLYDSIDDVEDLDDMGEDFLTADTAVRAERRLQKGDPCLTIRHYYGPEKARTDSGALTGCSVTAHQLNVEIMEVDLRYGLFLDRRTEFYAPGNIPLEFTRVLRTQDSRARAFGIGGTHNLNIFPVGDKWPFTWMDLITAEGGRVHYKRTNWGFGYWDATYSESDTFSNEFSGSKVSWNWPGWKLAEVSGRTYYFPDGEHRQRPEQAAVLAIEDGRGDRLNLPRDSAGNLIRAYCACGREANRELDFQYDQQNRVKHFRDRSGGANVDYEYDAAGRLRRAEEANGQVTTYSYDAKNRMIRVTQSDKQTDKQSENLVLTNEFDGADRVVRQTLPDGHMYTFKYSFDREGKVGGIDVVDSAGLTWKMSMIFGGQYTLKPVRNK
jgi:YD repeat-containing protein